MKVDAITEGMVLAVIAGTETGDNGWLREPMVNVESPGSKGPLGPFSSPPWGAHSCPAAIASSSSSEAIRNSRASRLARLAESSRQQGPG